MSKGSHVPKLFAALGIAALGGLGWFGWKLLEDPAPHEAPPAATSGAKPGPSNPASKAESAGSKAPIATATRDVEAIAPPPAPVEVAMPASYRKALSGVRGRLVEADGKPVGGLPVELLELLPSAFMGDYGSVFAGTPPKFPDLTVAKGRSGDDGVFVLEGTHGTAMHAVGVDLGGPRGSLRAIDRTLPSGEIFDLGDIVLGACVTYTGTVADEDGKPVPGARVRATTLPAIVFQPGVADVSRAAGILPRSGRRGAVEMAEFPEGMRAWESRLPLPTTKCGADGTFELKGVPQGLVTLVVDCEGFCGTFKGPAPTGKRDKDVGTIELSRGRDLHGIVVDTAGKPVAGCDVFGGVEIAAARLSVLFKGEPTGPDGRFKIEHLSPLAGALSVVARANPLQVPVVQPVEDPDREVTVTLPGACSLGVFLKSARDASPVDVEGVELWVNPTAEVPLLTFARPHRVPAAQIERIEPGHLLLRGLGAGRCSIFASAPGMARASAFVQVTAETTAEVTLELAPATALDVVVADAATQAPVEWASVSIGRGRRQMAATQSRRTDVQGSAKLTDVPTLSVKGEDDAAQTFVRAFHPAYAPQSRPLELSADAGGALAPMRFELRPGASLKGRIHTGSGGLAEPVMFVLESRNYDRESVDDLFPRLAVPGLDGTFEIKGLSPGTMSWTVITRIFGGDVTAAIEKVASMAPLRRGAVELEEGKTTELDIDLDPSQKDAPARITGTVHVRGARRPESLRLSAHSQSFGGREQGNSEKSIDVIPERPFTLEVAPGWINASLSESVKVGDQTQLKGLYNTWFQVDPGQARELVIDLEFVTARILVVDAAGNALPHVVINMYSSEREKESFNANAWGETGDDGVAEVELPQPGSWRCQIQNGKVGRGDATFQFPSSRVERIAVTRGVPCAGRLEIKDDPGGQLSFYLQFQRVSQEGNVYYDESVGMSLEPGARTFDVVGLDPGHYRVNLWGQRWARDAVDVELPSGGRSDFVLRFTLAPPRPQEDG